MGTGGKTTHQSYTVAPTLAPPNSTEHDAAAPAVTDTDTDTDLILPSPASGAATMAGPLDAAAPLPLSVPAPQVSAPGEELEDEDPADEESESAAVAPAPAGEEEAAGAGADAAPPIPDGDQAGPDGQAEPSPPTLDRPADVLTPIPTELNPGDNIGVPVLAGGEDLVASTATLVSYDGKDGPREVLHATVTEQAEAKLFEALGITGEPKMVPAVVEQEVNGRLPADEQGQLHELVSKAAKSVNARLKTGEPIPEHVKDYLATAEQAVTAVETNPAATADELAMAAHYRAHLAAIGARVDGTVTAPYADGGKIPQTDPYLHTGVATVTTMVPAAPDPPADGLLPTTTRQATRIKPTFDSESGAASWNGKARTKAPGTEYAIDLGDGYTAVYRPYAANDAGETDYSLRGRLEVIAPSGAGHAPELVERLGQLHLVNRPMTAAEGEWTYLTANITAQNLAGVPTVTKALSDSAGLEDLAVQELFYANAHAAVGKDDTQLAAMARDLQLEAAARVLPRKVALVRDAVAAAAGHASGASLASSPGYDPTPQRSAGWLTWSRFDVAGGGPQLTAAWKGKSLVHNVNSGSLLNMLRGGGLASTERRATMGIAKGVGTSEDADKKSGGASSVFLRVRSSKNVTGVGLVWDNPQTLMRRADYYAYPSDQYGAINPSHHLYKTGELTRDPVKIAGFASSSSNEIMFRDGIDVLGTEAPSRIVCGDAATRDSVLSLLHGRKITHLGGKPVDQVVTI
ncbi:hypothetical protein [Micromonospora aurantiaca (nom. illeg.)]|uniref:hypothetical protein n=1 Tax=Micromonospora aurantiaca (nom. illeg.) TaxID=47850 RepID=UPI0033D9F4C3